MIKLIMFDFDGVIDNNYNLSFELCSKKFLNITVEEHKKQYDGNVHLEREKMKERDTGFDFLKCLSDGRKDRKIEEETKSTLVDLVKNFKLGVISSCHEYGIKDYLKNNGVDNLFSFVYGLETHKLKTFKFKKILNEFNLKENECIFITDTLGDILEANEVGIKTIAVDFGYHERERLQKGNPLKIISRFEELIETVKNL
ncbi:MAG: HAD-IA family hydrolase [Candidatus Nomurabacteria bacterium]|nr:HAD-IA family hydrolase [Candidatus Nomurabacteria bacterium]